MSFKERQKQNGYDKFIRNQIKQLGLGEIAQYTRCLTVSEKAKMMSKSHVFVMSSDFENHSSKPKETMTVRVSCVSSYGQWCPRICQT